MKINLFKIKDGKLETWLEWGRLIMGINKKEAIDTLKEEGLTYEACGVFLIDKNYYTIGIFEGKALPENMNRKLNVIHKEKKKECLKYIGPVELSYELYSN